MRRQSSPDPERRADAEQRVRQIDEAEKTLLDAAARRAFDERRERERERRRSPLPPPREETAGRRSTEGPHWGGRTAADWLERAHAYLEQGNTGAAARAAREATELAGNDPSAWFVYGLAHAADGRPGDAELGFAEALRLEPENPDFHRGLGEALLDQKKWRRAATSFQHVLERIPDDVRARAGLGAAFVHSGNVRQGLSLLERVARERPDDPTVQAWLASAWHQAALDGLSQVDDGTPVALSGRQVALLRRHARKIRGLGSSDPSVQAREQDLRALLREARRPVWIPSLRKRYYLIALAIAVFLTLFSPPGLHAPGYRVFGVVLGSAVALVYVHRHRVPAWKIRRWDWTYRVSKRGM